MLACPTWFGSCSGQLVLRCTRAEGRTLKKRAFLTVDGQEPCCDHQSPSWFGPQSMGTNSMPSESA